MIHPSDRVTIIFMWLIAATLSIRAVAACVCPPPPPPAGIQPVVRVPSLRGEHSAVFVGVVAEVYPRSLAEYRTRWRQIYREDLSEDRSPSVEQMRDFMLQFWPNLFSPSEQERIRAAESLDDLESAVGRFWLTPRRIRLRVEEPFAGPKAGPFVLYTGLAGGDCGVDFKVGDQWLIIAYLDDGGRWIAHLCSGTTPVKNAGAVLKALRSERQ